MEFRDVIETLGLKVPFDPKIITPVIERCMRNNYYEHDEVRALRAVLQADDRVLELGGRVGLCSTVIAKIPSISRVVAIEANPEMISMIEETHRLNPVSGLVEVRNFVVTSSAASEVPFYIRSDFWSSSMDKEAGPFDRVAMVPSISLRSLLAEISPTLLVCDIEGGELGLFDNVDLSGVETVIMELHPKVYGTEGCEHVVSVLAAQGLHVSPLSKQGNSVQVFSRRSSL
ncbi:FkbM family methyltransferase [Donghicola sp. XS_ASV15]|uniref:FkbM family methyltransferase n=1 Tax=Donghicola sp. XS_ASV15 TaxID=3241295 RepID=UPI0035110B36